MIKNFSCFKNNDKKDNQPDYRLSAKVGDKYVEIGAGWIKENAHGKYMSFSLKKPTEHFPGFSIVEDTPIDEKVVEQKLDEVAKELSAKTPDVKYPDEKINPDDIPF